MPPRMLPSHKVAKRKSLREQIETDIPLKAEMPMSKGDSKFLARVGHLPGEHRQIADNFVKMTRKLRGMQRSGKHVSQEGDVANEVTRLAKDVSGLEKYLTKAGIKTADLIKKLRK